MEQRNFEDFEEYEGTIKERLQNYKVKKLVAKKSTNINNKENNIKILNMFSKTNNRLNLSEKVFDLCTVKKYNKDYYKMVILKRGVYRNGFEGKKHLNIMQMNKICNSNLPDQEQYNFKNQGINDNKLDNNLIRARSKILELALCNEFKYFITFTIDRKKYNRYNLKNYLINLAKFIKAYNRKYNIKIEYVFIPEMHSDNAWHVHGLIKGIKEEHLKNFDDIKNVPLRLKNKEYYNFDLYKKKFGFCSLGKIRDNERCAIYMTKYITKSLSNGVIELNEKTFFTSNNLSIAQTINKGILPNKLIPENMFENDFCKIAIFKKPSQIFKEINNNY